MNRPAWATICPLVFAVSSALAQGTPVFTARTAHPYDAPVLGQVRDAEPPSQRVSDRPIPRGKTPRAHAQELAEVFRQACLVGRGQIAPAADWALQHGFSPMSEAAMKEFTRDAAPPGEGVQPVNVFVRQLDATDSVMLMLGEGPLACSVVTHQAVDGARLRERVGRLVAAWTGQVQPPAPVLSLDLPASAARSVGYKVSSGRQVDSFMVTAPLAVGQGLTLLALSIDDAPPAR